MKQATIKFKFGLEIVVYVPAFSGTYDYIRDNYDISEIDTINGLKTIKQ